MAQQAAEEGAELLVLPEMWLTGYNIGNDVWALAEPADGPAADAIADIARETGVAVLYGYPERSGNAVYNSAQLLDSRGKRQLNVRKTHLFGAEEMRLFAPGDSLSKVVELNGAHLAVLICYDVEFPEAVRSLALNGAELILVPTALFEPFRFIAEHVVRVRAWESQLYLAYANRCGREGALQYVGGSSICTPDGELAAAAGAQPQRIGAAIDTARLETLRKENPYLNDRRPQLYRSE